MADLLTLRYLPISKAELFDGNAKLHDIDKIIRSIKKYGFKSAPKWESKLNNGRGGIVAGNGRVEALRKMEQRGDDLPIGIAQDETGEWCVPVLFGVEASSEVTAQAYALDDNNLTVLGGDFALSDLTKLYDQELLMAELEELAQWGDLPITFDYDFIDDSVQQLLTESNSTNKEYPENNNQSAKRATQEVASSSTDRQYSESSVSSSARSYADVTDESVEKASQKLQSQFNTPAKKEENNLITCPHCGGDFVYK